MKRAPDSDDRFARLVDAIEEYAIFLLDREGRVETWNAGAERIDGYTREEIVGRHFSIFYPPETRDTCQATLDTAAARGRIELEGTRVRKDGKRFWANVVITAIKDDDGNVVGFGKITRDLTERKRAEEELRFSEERFRLLVESVQDYAIFMLDPTGHVMTWNTGAERMKGYRAEEIIGKHFSVFYPRDDIEAGKCEMELEGAQAEGRFEDEGWRLRKDGSTFWANVILTALRDPSGRLVGFTKVTRDLTLRKRAEEARARLIQAEEANRVKDEFLATVSHELRTPLNAILGWATLLKDRVGDAAAAKAAETIRRNALAQARIIEDVLDVSRIITGKLRIDAKPMDLAAIVREAIQVVTPAANAKNIAISFAEATDLTLLVGDAARLQQVVWNLLSNAVKFTDRDGRVFVELDHVGSSLCLSVRDTGCGIAPEFLPHAFERFRQADSSMTRKFGGLGLGLAIVRHIVEMHGGRVSVESQGVGKGATFRVELPIRAVLPRAAASDEAPSPIDVQDRARTSDRLDGICVLVVDDEADARELIEAVLRDRGALVRTAASAEEARDALEHVRPHVLVSDVGMPEEDGYALICSVRALPPEAGGTTPAVALTAYARSHDRVRALQAGFDEHVSKPVDPDALVAVIKRLAGVAPARSDSGVA